jgi:hypothetical protein
MNTPYLEGYFYTLTKVKNPPSVDVLDLDAVADEYKRVNVCLPAEDWKVLLDALPEERRRDIISRLFKHDVTPELADMKPVLQRDEFIPGARLKTQEYRVEIR